VWNQNQAILIHFLQTQPEVVHTSKETANTGLHVEEYMDEKAKTKQNKGLCHTMALPFTLKSVLRQKKNLWKFKYFTMQKYNLQK
jgi:hypothetical protein